MSSLCQEHQDSGGPPLSHKPLMPPAPSLEQKLPNACYILTEQSVLKY